MTDALRDLGSYVGIGLGMALALLAGLGAGYWIDGKLGTRPVFFLVGALFGMGSVAWQFYKVYVMTTGRK